MSRAAAIREMGCLCAGLLLGAGTAGAAEPAADRASETPSFTALPMSTTGGSAPALGPVIEISASNLPRLDNLDGSTGTRQRLDMALLSPGRASFGVTMGLSGLAPTARAGLNPGAGEGVKSINLGLQWRYVFDNSRRIDITAWRDLGRPDDALALIRSRDAGYGARVELQLASSRSPLVAERGFVGVQLDGGARITLRRSGGRPMIYYRNKF